VEQIVAARQRHPTWGASKLRAWLIRRAPETAWPCRDTIHQVLRRAGVVRHRRRRPRLPRPASALTVATHPNALWTIDFKGEFRTGDGVWCYPLTLRDAFSRYVLRCTALPQPRLAETQAQCARAFAIHGLPDRIRSDNGPPFGGVGLARLSRLAVWWLRLGIQLERITPGHPEQNGAHEQFHAVLKRDTAHPPASHRTAQQRRFAAFVAEYNHDRPHAALGHTPPGLHYTPSPRALPARLPPLEYPLGWAVRRVSWSGFIKWHSRRVFLSSVLAQQDVAFEPVDDGRWLLRLATTPLAIFDERRWRLLTPHTTAASAGPLASEGPAPAAESVQ
jgi:putative transposase